MALNSYLSPDSGYRTCVTRKCVSVYIVTRVAVRSKGDETFPVE